MSESAQISQELQALLDQFSASGADASTTAQYLTAALQSDSALADQFNSEVALGALKGFAVGAPAGQAANARNSTGIITFNSTEVDKESINALIFQAGHEGQHLVNDVSVADSQFDSDVNDLAAKGPGQDYTQLVAGNQLAHNQDEAIANITGWNDYVNNFENQWSSSHPNGPNPTSADLYAGKLGYANYFIDIKGNALPGITLNPDLTISATAANITAEGNAYYLGANLGAVSYPSFNGAWQLSVIAAAVGPNGWGALDFQAIPGLNLGQVATQLNRTAGGTPLGAGSFTIHDTSTNATNTFSTSSGGTTITSQTATALGDGTRFDTTTYDPNGQLTQTQSMSDADGAVQNSFSTVYSDYQQTARLTETSTTNDATAGTRTITNVDYNGAGGTECTFDTKVTPILGNGAAISEVSGTETDDGTVQTAQVSGTGSTIDASNAAITVADGGMTDVTGEGNTVRLGDGASATLSNADTVENAAGTVHTSGQSLVITGADGETLSVSEDTNGDGKTDVQEKISLGANGATTTDLKDLTAEGAVSDESLTVAQVDGSKAVSFDQDGNGLFEETDKFNAGDKETDALLFDNSTGAQTKDAQYDVSTGVIVDILSYDGTGHETDEAFYAPSGQLTGDGVLNLAGQQTDYLVFDPVTGLETQDQQFDLASHTVADALNFAADGRETDEAFYNPAGQELQDSQFDLSTGMEADRLLFNTAGQETALLRFDGSGRETQEQQFDLSTGSVVDALNFNASGQETDEAYYNLAGQEMQDSRFNLSTGMEVDRVLFNTSGQQTDLLVFNASGQEAQDSQFSTTTGDETDRFLYNSAGQQTDLLFFDPSGQETQDQQFNVSNGTVADVLNYNNAGQESDEAFYNPSGQEIGDARFSPGFSYASEVDIFDANGIQIERDTFNQSSGALDEVDLWNGSSPYAYEREVASGGAYFSEVDDYDANSGAMTGGAQFNGQTGAETEYESGGYWYGYNADSPYYAPSGDDGYGGFGYAGAGYSGGDDDGDDDWDDMDPVILNLQGGKVQTQSLATSRASFGMQNNGQAVKTGWATAGEGVLVYDATHSGTVKNEDSLVSGFDALQTLDCNGDGRLDASDAAWSDLKVWVDQSGTGQFNAGSLYGMAQLGIASIDLRARRVNQNDHGNTILDDSSFTRTDGTTGDIAGVNLSFNPMSNLNTVQTQASTQLNQLISAMASFASPASALTAVSAANDRRQSPLLAVAH
jgi:hypothetical protein